MGLHEYVSDPPCCDQTGEPSYYETREVAAADYLESYRRGGEPRCHETCENRGGASRGRLPAIRVDTSYLSSESLGASTTPTACKADAEHLYRDDGTTYDASSDSIRSLSYRESDVAKLIKFNKKQKRW